MLLYSIAIALVHANKAVKSTELYGSCGAPSISATLEGVSDLMFFQASGGVYKGGSLNFDEVANSICLSLLRECSLKKAEIPAAFFNCGKAIAAAHQAGGTQGSQCHYKQDPFCGNAKATAFLTVLGTK
jgi:hypothetical protein